MLRAGSRAGLTPRPLGAHRWAWACMPAAASRERPAPSSPRVDSRAAVGRAVPKRVTPAPAHCARRCPRGGQGPGAVHLRWLPWSWLQVSCAGLCVALTEWPRLAGALAAGDSWGLCRPGFVTSLPLPSAFISVFVCFSFRTWSLSSISPLCRLYQPSRQLPAPLPLVHGWVPSHAPVWVTLGDSFPPRAQGRCAWPATLLTCRCSRKRLDGKCLSRLPPKGISAPRGAWSLFAKPQIPSQERAWEQVTSCFDSSCRS